MNGGCRGASKGLRLLGVLAAVSALTVALGAGTAAAHKRTFQSNVQIKVDALSDTVLQLSGKVTSDRAKCVRNRKVKVTANGVEIARAGTLRNGFWAVHVTPRPPKGTKLIAFTPRKFLKRSKKHKHKCLSDFSEKKAP